MRAPTQKRGENAGRGAVALTILEGGARVRLEESQNGKAGLDPWVWQVSALLVPKDLEPAVAPEGLS